MSQNLQVAAYAAEPPEVVAAAAISLEVVAYVAEPHKAAALALAAALVLSQPRRKGCL